MTAPRPKPDPYPANPRKEGGERPAPAPPSKETGMVGEGGEARGRTPEQREKPGGMIGEG